MRSFAIALIATLACSSAETTEAPIDAERAPPGRTPAHPTAVVPVYRMDVRVHTGYTEMTQPMLGDVLAEAQSIWTSQASICFEFVLVADDAEAENGFELWFLPEIPGAPGVNGTIDAGRRIFVRDRPELAQALRPVRHPAARTTAHEFGHGLSLGHYEQAHDLSESLMASRQSGYALHDFEVALARQAASAFGEEERATYACAPPPAR